MGTWSIGGNALGNASQGVIGTTDSNALVLETADIPRMRIEANGDVSIGEAGPVGQLNLTTLTILRILSNEIWLGMPINGGGQLRFANNQGDNKVYIEGYNAAGNAAAEEILLTGPVGGTIPQISLVAGVTYVTGDLNVAGAISGPTITGLAERVELYEKRIQSLQDELTTVHAALAASQAHS